MPLVHFAFIVKGPGYQPADHTTSLVSDSFQTRVVGVPNLEIAIEAAKRLVLQGVQLIELCGGFSQEEASRLHQEIGLKVPVGVVVYSEEQTRELQRIFG